MGFGTGLGKAINFVMKTRKNKNVKKACNGGQVTYVGKRNMKKK